MKAAGTKGEGQRWPLEIRQRRSQSEICEFDSSQLQSGENCNLLLLLDRSYDPLMMTYSTPKLPLWGGAGTGIWLFQCLLGALSPRPSPFRTFAGHEGSGLGIPLPQCHMLKIARRRGKRDQGPGYPLFLLIHHLPS